MCDAIEEVTDARPREIEASGQVGHTIPGRANVCERGNCGILYKETFQIGATSAPPLGRGPVGLAALRPPPWDQGPPRLSQSRQVRPIALRAVHLAGFSAVISRRSGTYRPQPARPRAAPSFFASTWTFLGRLTTGRASRLGGLAKGQGQVT